MNKQWGSFKLNRLNLFKDIQYIYYCIAVDTQFSRLLFILCTSSMIAESWECKILPLWGSIHFSISIYWLIGIKHKHLALEGIPSGHWKQNVNTQNIQNIFFYSFPSVIPFSFPWHVFHNVKIPRNYREWDRQKLKVVTQPKV